jgi:cell wall-associated NlpC family hydrolase
VLRRAAIGVIAACVGSSFVVASRAAGQSVSSLRREAARIEADLEDTADRLSALAEDRLEARERLAGIRRDATDAQGELRTVSAGITARRAALVERALATYTSGAGSVSSLDLGLSLDANVDRDVYRELRSGVERDVLDRLRAEEEDLSRRRRRLTRLEEEATALQASLRRAEREAIALEARQSALLERARGRLGAAVEAERRRREAEEEARERARVAARERDAARRRGEAARDARRRAAAGRSGLSGRLRGGDGESSRPGAAGAMVFDEQPAAPGGSVAVQVALAQVGKPYVWGATGPGGFDCSGLMLYAWRSAGRQLPRTSRAQYAGTRRVAISQLRPGDLVFFAKPGRAIHHVGMYIGGGQMVEASRRGAPVRTRSIFRRDLIGAGRI